MSPANILAVAIPTLAILFGILLNRQDAISIRAELKAVESALRNEMAQLRKDINADMLQLRKDLNADMVQLRNSIHADMVGLHERIAVVEAKQQG